MKDDEESNRICFLNPLQRPAGPRRCADARLLELDDHASRTMATLLHMLEVGPEGVVPATPDTAGRALKAWLYGIGRVIVARDLAGPVLAAINPMPAGTNREEATRIFSGNVVPARASLEWVLWSIGIGPHTITAAVTLQHRAIDPVTVRIGKSSAMPGTTGFRRAVRGAV